MARSAGRHSHSLCVTSVFFVKHGNLKIYALSLTISPLFPVFVSSCSSQQIHTPAYTLNMAPNASRSCTQLAIVFFILSVCFANQVLSAPTAKYHQDSTLSDTPSIPVPIRLDDALESVRVRGQEDPDRPELVQTLHQRAVLAKDDVIEVLERRTPQKQM